MCLKEESRECDVESNPKAVSGHCSTFCILEVVTGKEQLLTVKKLLNIHVQTQIAQNYTCKTVKIISQGKKVE
jgi:hypothetical protein